MTYSRDVIEEVISGDASAHFTPHGALYTSLMTDDGVLITIQLGNWATSKFVRLRGIPMNIQSELTHCVTHSLALSLLQHLYPA